MDILDILRADYDRFPKDQTYSIYAEDVYFKDPVYEFRGRDRYQKMIRFIDTWFLNPNIEVHAMQQNGNQIRTDWTLTWQTPLPWKPHIRIPGWSEITLNDTGQIITHLDFWHCSKFEVLRQHFGRE